MHDQIYQLWKNSKYVKGLVLNSNFMFLIEFFLILSVMLVPKAHGFEITSAKNKAMRNVRCSHPSTNSRLLTWKYFFASCFYTINMVFFQNYNLPKITIEKSNWFSAKILLQKDRLEKPMWLIFS